MPARRTKPALKPTPPRAASITRLQDFKAARHAAHVLEGLLHEPPWLRDVRACALAGEVRIVVRLLYPTPQARMCTPARVNSIPVHIEADGEEA